MSAKTPLFLTKVRKTETHGLLRNPRNTKRDPCPRYPLPHRDQGLLHTKVLGAKLNACAQNGAPPQPLPQPRAAPTVVELVAYERRPNDRETPRPLPQPGAAPTVVELVAYERRPNDRETPRPLPQPGAASTVVDVVTATGERNPPGSDSAVDVGAAGLRESPRLPRGFARSSADGARGSTRDHAVRARRGDPPSSDIR
jgi:hypothetical protein